ncbi:unnamed protein product [Rotaria magnacalcarata]
MSLKSYCFRLKTASETFTQQNNLSNSDTLLIYFKGEKGLTQPLSLLLIKLNESLYENTIELLDVENVNKANNLKKSLSALLIFIYIVLTGTSSTYTIIIRTGSMRCCSQATIRLALIGDGASTLPFNLNSNTSSIQCISKNLFQPNSKDIFYISSFQSIDVGQLFHIKLQCGCHDSLPYYCKSIEVINNLTDVKYFFLVNHWFGSNLEKHISVPVIDRTKESNVFTISTKTRAISNSIGWHMIYVHMNFANGKSYEEVCISSETHQIPFQKDNVDFFLVFLDNIDDTKVSSVKVCFVNKSTEKIIEVKFNTIIHGKKQFIETFDSFLFRNKDSSKQSWASPWLRVLFGPLTYPRSF